MDLSDHVARRVDELAPAADRLLVALSGGADSVAALLLLLEAGKRLAAAHLDHGLRPDSTEDARFVRELCAGLGVELIERSVDVAALVRKRGWNLEDGARRVRYGVLHRAAAEAGCGAIVVAHTRDDQAETFLLQVLRGSAYPGGMPAARGMVVRPLLDVPRQALRGYLQGRGQPWREDVSNRDHRRTRAWIRHAVMPLLSGRYPAAAARLAATASSVREARDALDELALTRFGTGPLRVTALARAPRAVQRSAIAGLLGRAGVTPDRDLVTAVMTTTARAAAAHGEQRRPWRRSVGEDVFVRVAYGTVAVVRRATSSLPGPVAVADTAAWRAAVDALPGTVAGGRAALPSDEEVAAWLVARGPLTLRHREPGDRATLPAGRRLLSDLLIDRAVPREERDALLVLAAGGDVLWVSGVPLAAGTSVDERFMLLAIAQAEAAAAAGELPVGAVLVRGDDLVAAAHNRSQSSGDPSAHAELEVLRRAGTEGGDWHLAGTTLYVTLEPCPMCFGAVLQTRIERVVYGADNLREGALGGVVDLAAGPWKRVPSVEGGVLAARCARLLTSFFAARRTVASGSADTPPGP